MITRQEIEAGAIEHALVIAYPGILPRRFTPPASTGSDRGYASNGLGIPCGGRVQLDPNLDVSRLGLTRSGEIVARALQKYGAYVGDFSDSITLYAENSSDTLAFWNRGVLDKYDLRNKIDLSLLRVIRYNTLYY